MEKVIGKYETVFIINPTLGEEETGALVEKFKTLISENGEVLKVDVWGKRRLAYLVKDFNEGYYVLIEFTAATNFVSELERIYTITDGVIRSLVVRK